MGRTFENRKHAMAKRGARDAKAFTKAGRQLSMAVKSGGPDPAANPALRRAIQNARAVSMPKDKIQSAIDKAAGNLQDEAFQEVLYEGFGPHSIAFLVQTATDNPTRTVANIRSYFKKANGSLGTNGSVAFMFEQLGAFSVNPEDRHRDELELELIDHGLCELTNVVGEGGRPLWLVYCQRDDCGKMQLALEERKIDVISSSVQWIPKTTVLLANEQCEDIVKLYERFEDDDDVQEVFCNLAE